MTVELKREVVQQMGNKTQQGEDNSSDFLMEEETVLSRLKLHDEEKS
jgi:hypothetical protein